MGEVREVKAYTRNKWGAQLHYLEGGCCIRTEVSFRTDLLKHSRKMYWDSCLLFIKHPPTLIHAVSICRNAVCGYFTVTHRVAIKRKSTTRFLTNRDLQEPYILKFWGFYLCLIKVCISHSIKFASGRCNLNQQWHKQPHIFVIQAQTSKNYPWLSYHLIW